MFKEQSHRGRGDGTCQTLCLVQFPHFPLDVDTRKPRFPPKPTRLEAWSSSQQPGQGMEPISRRTVTSVHQNKLFLSVPGPITDPA